MSRTHFYAYRFASALGLGVFRLLAGAALAIVGVGTLSITASASTLSPTSRSWCSAYGGDFAGWAGTAPEMPICGPGPDYGGSWQLVALPGPGGTDGGYFSGTPGFQCVELAERYLAVAYGFVPTDAEGATVAANYHSEYARTTLVVNGSKAAVGHPPVRGDVISFSFSPTFDSSGDGHVAVVVKSKVNSSGDGSVVVAQQNVSSADYVYTLGVSSWRVFDPSEPSDAEFQFPYAEWLHVVRRPIVHRASVLIAGVHVAYPTMHVAAL